MLSPNNSNDYQKIKDVFIDALDVAPEKRSDFLDKFCANAHLRAEVESLLKARAEAGEFLNNVSAAAVVQQSVDVNDKFIGRKIGNYRIEREIGRGGMGVVFAATREDFHQKAAIKLIKRGMDSDAILERFTREREILAALNHPYIARLTDGGTTDEGVPFFVMECVEGVPVDEYCRQNDLIEKEILELFRKICEAVSFAHQKLIVHRDLKPSNILITADGTPKLLDFGIAKLLNSTDANDTKTNQRVLTPAYASPEQMRGETVDTTSDVYSLGKILAELLQVSDPKSRSTIVKNSRQSLSTDLQAVLQTALREETTRRYNSVEKFSEDIRRHLIGLPVSARKDTFRYRAAKFVQRKRYAVAFAAVFVLTLFSGMLTTLWQAREARRERAVAERRFDNLRKISGSFVTEIHEAVKDLPGSLPARQLLLSHAVEQLDILAGESGDNPALQDELAQAYHNSADLPDMLLAQKTITFNKEIAIYQKLIAADSMNVRYREQLALAEIALGDITKVRGSVGDGINLESRGTARLEQIVADEPENIEHLSNLTAAYNDLASLYLIKDDVVEAAKIYEKTLVVIEKIRRLNPAEPQLTDLSDIADLHFGIQQTIAGNYPQAVNIFREKLAEYTLLHAKSPNDTRINYFLWIINRRLADVLDKSGDVRSAAKHWQNALSIIESLAAESPKDFGYFRNSAITNISYGKMLVRRNRPAQAIKYFRRAIEASSKVFAADAEHAEAKADAARAYANLGSVLLLNGNNAEGLRNLREAIKIFVEICPADAENAPLQADYSQAREWLDKVSKTD